MRWHDNKFRMAPLSFVPYHMKTLMKDQEKLISYVRFFLPLDTSILSRSICLHSLLINAMYNSDENIYEEISTEDWIPEVQPSRQELSKIISRVLQSNPGEGDSSNQHLTEGEYDNRIHWTVEFIDILRYLITEGADPNWAPEEQKGKSSVFVFARLVQCVVMEHDQLFEQLLELLEMLMTESSVAADFVDEKGRTVLHVLVDADWTNLNDHLKTEFTNHFKQVIKLVVKRNESILNVQNSSKETPLHTFLSVIFYNRSKLDFVVLQFVNEIIPYLKSATNADIQNDAGFTPLHQLMQFAYGLNQENMKEFIKLLNNLRTSSNVEALSCDGETVLHLLMRRMNHLLALEWDILNKFVASILTCRNVNITDRNSITPYTWILHLKQSLHNGKLKRTQEEIEVFLKIDEMFLDKQGNVSLGDQGLEFINVKHLLQNLNNAKDIDEGVEVVLKHLQTTETLTSLRGSSILLKMVEKAHILIESDGYMELIKKLIPTFDSPGTNDRKQLLLSCLMQQIQMLLCRPKKMCSLIQVLLPVENNVLTRKEFLRRLLMHAQQQKDLLSMVEFYDVVRFLVQNGADPNWTPRKSKDLSAIFIYIRAVREILLKHDHLFAHCRDILEFLLPDELPDTDPGGKTILHYLVGETWNDLENSLQFGFSKRFSDIIRFIKQTYPEMVDTQDFENRSPLYSFICAVLRDNHVVSRATFKFLSETVDLLKSSKNVDMQDKLGLTVLHVVANAITHTTTKESLENLLELAVHLKTCQNIECQEKNGETVLHVLSKNISDLAKGDLFSILLNRLPDFMTETNINVTDQNSATPFSWVLHWKNSWINKSSSTQITVLKVEEFFLENGAKPALAESGLRCMRGKEMGTILKAVQWKSQTLDNIFRQLTDIKELGFPECLVCPYLMQETINFSVLFLRIENPQLQRSSKEILASLIHPMNSQRLFEVYMLMMYRNITWKSQFVLSSWLWLLETCLDTGAKPSKEDVEKVAGTFNRCRSSEEQLQVLQTTHSLLVSFRESGNKDVVECDLGVLKNSYHVIEGVRNLGIAVVRLAYTNLENCTGLVNVLLFAANDLHDDIKKDFLKEYFKLAENVSAENWLQRGILHLAVMLCDNQSSLLCILENNFDVNERDLHGCTPLHVAYLHHNYQAVKILKSHGAQSVLDVFNIAPESLADRVVVCPKKGQLKTRMHEKILAEEHADVLFQNSCHKIMDAQSGVLQKLKPMLVIPARASTLLGEHLVTLIESLIKQTEYGQYIVKAVVTGSVRERLKVGRLDEVDIHIQLRSPIYERDALSETGSNNVRYDAQRFGRLFHESLIKALDKVSWQDIPLRLININHPWQFLCEAPLQHIVVSVDLVPVLAYKEYARDTISIRQGFILQNSHRHKKTEFMKWAKRYNEGHSFLESYAAFEWDIVDSLSTDCRLGVLIVKSLLQAYYWHAGLMTDPNVPITSYMVKTTLYWLLSKQDFFDIKGDAVQLKRRGATQYSTKLKNNPKPKWMVECDIDECAEEGRLWACDILNVTLQIAQDYERKLPNYFGSGSVLQSCEIGQADHIAQICTILLKLLEPGAFY